LSLERFTVADSKGGKDLARLMIAGGHSASDLWTNSDINNVHGAQGFWESREVLQCTPCCR